MNRVPPEGSGGPGDDARGQDERVEGGSPAGGGAAGWRTGEIIAGRYEVRAARTGGGCCVYRVWDRECGKDVAVKMLRPEFATERHRVARFRAEIEQAATVPAHPNVLGCAFTEIAGVPVAISEWAEGGTLRDWIEDGRLYDGGSEAAQVRILDTAIQAATGLAHLHRHGVVHQDVKPGNLLLTEVGEVRVADAQLSFGPERLPLRVLTGGHAPRYCSPEQMRGELTVMQATDVWSIAVTIIAMYRDGAAWAAGTEAPQYLERREGLDAASHLPSMPLPVVSLLRKCLEEDADRRPQQIGELAAALKEIFREVTGREYPPDRIAPSMRPLAGGNDNGEDVEDSTDPGDPRQRARGTVEPYDSNVPGLLNPGSAIFETTSCDDVRRWLYGPGYTDEECNVPAEWRAGDVILDVYEVLDSRYRGMVSECRVRQRDWGMYLDVTTAYIPGRGFHGSDEMREARFHHDVARFYSACSEWASLARYPHIVNCFGIRFIGGLPRALMEWVNGGSLADWIEDGRLYQGGHDAALARILDIAIQAAWGLHHLHQQGIIHQDIKPGNILVSDDEPVKVRLSGAMRSQIVTRVAGDPDDTVHCVPAGFMTRAFRSSEQANRRELTRRSDVWSLGLTLLATFTGHRVPWDLGEQAPDHLRHVWEGGSSRADIPSIPGDLIELLRKSFREDPRERPHDMLVFAAALQEIYEHATGSRYPRTHPELIEADAASLNNRGLSALEQARYELAQGRTRDAAHLIEAAITRLDDALRRDPIEIAARYNRGLVLWRKGLMAYEELMGDLESMADRCAESRLPSRLLTQLQRERDDQRSAPFEWLPPSG